MRKGVVVLALLAAALHVTAAKRDPAYRDARRNGAQARIELHVADDDGTPVGGAEVKAFLGMNFRPKGSWVKGLTDTNGVFVVEGRTCGDEIEVFVAKAGYYDSRVKYCYATMGAEHEVADGKWQPYGGAVPLLLRKINAPTEMSIMEERRFRSIRSLNKWVGYDLQTYDFVAPHGTGRVSDCEVLIDWDGKWIPEYKGMEVRIRFPSPLSGYYPVKAAVGSEFVGPYSAVVDATYCQEAIMYEKMINGGTIERSQFDRGKCWAVRTRCKVDDDGSLLSANYATIYNIESSCEPDGSAALCIMGVFNPTPNDTNLEPKREGAR